MGEREAGPGKRELLDDGRLIPGEDPHTLAAIFVRAVEDLEYAAGKLRASIDKAAAASTSLQRVLAWLTAVLAVATAVGALAAAWSVWG